MGPGQAQRRDAGVTPTRPTLDAAVRDAGRDAAAPREQRDASPPSDQDAGRNEDDRDAGPAEPSTYVYVGGWDWSGAAYPYQSYALDRQSGELQRLDTTDVGANPSYSTPSADGRFLYIVNEYDDTAGVTTASLEDRVARSIAHQGFSGGRGLVFASLEPAGKFLLATSYAGGAVVVYPVEQGGKLGEAVDTHTFEPPEGEAEAQSHSVRVHPSGRWAYVPCKALDNIAQFAFDATSGKLTPLPAAVLDTGADSEPRHIALTPSGELALVAFEGSSRIGSYRVLPTGALAEVEVKSLLPEGWNGDNTGAHVLVHPNGRFVYASNRGHDSIAVFALTAAGRLTLLEHESSRGSTPRNFDIDKSGTLLVVANQGDGDGNGSLAVFEIEPDGTLSRTGSVLSGLKSPNSVSIVQR
jgi:6-phosphogluconolactonase